MDEQAREPLAIVSHHPRPAIDMQSVTYLVRLQAWTNEEKNKRNQHASRRFDLPVKTKHPETMCSSVAEDLIGQI